VDQWIGDAELGKPPGLRLVACSEKWSWYERLRKTTTMKLRIELLKTAVLLLTCLLGTSATRAGIIANTTEPFEQAVFIDCDEDGIPEDVLLLSGDLHILITQTSNKAGDTVVTDHFQPVNVSGVGLITGDTYRAVGLTRDSDAIQGDHESFTFVNNFYMIGQKSGIKSLIHNTFHITMVGGEVIATVDNSFTTCH